MTITELKKTSDNDLMNLFNGIPEPSYRTINTENESLENITTDFSNQSVSQEERESLQEKLTALA